MNAKKLKTSISHGHDCEHDNEFDIESIIDKFAFDKRLIYIWGDVDSNSAIVAVSLLGLYFESSDDPVTIIIHSDGGEVDATMSIIDEINYHKNRNRIVSTIAHGKAFSAGAFILAAGSKGHRLIKPNATVMLHSVAYGTAQDYAINQEAYADFMKQSTLKLYQINATDLGITEKKEFNKYTKELQRGLWLDAEGAVARGVVDQIVK
jgi:ATP-dependent Clp protease, protease subunit